MSDTKSNDTKMFKGQTKRKKKSFPTDKHVGPLKAKAMGLALNRKQRRALEKIAERED